MRFTVGVKLALGFGAVLVLMAASTVVSYVGLRSMSGVQASVVQQRFPTALASRTLESNVNQSLAALRGYIILGADALQGQQMQAARARAWEDIAEAMKQLEALSASDSGEGGKKLLSELTAEVAAFRSVQDEIEGIAHSPDNLPATKLLVTEAAPRADAMLRAITALIDEEAKLDATPERKALLGHFADSRGSLGVGLASIRAYLLTGSDAFKKDFLDRWARNQSAYEAIVAAESLLTPAQAEQWRTYKAARAEFAPLPTRMFELRSGDEWNMANYWLGTRAAPRASAIRTRVADMIKAQEQAVASEVQALERSRATLVTTLLSATGIALFFGVVISVMLGRRIVGSVRLAAGRAEEIARGDLRGAALAINSRDELGDLVRSMNGMSESLRTLVKELQGTSQEVAAAATEIAASGEEMSAASSEVARQAVEASTAAAESNRLAGDGGEVVAKTVEGMKLINETVSASAASVTELGERSQQIGKVVAVINDIADQTNLLALNAAIEAARAGEHGRGFAVVADEVRKLADRTTKATEEIAGSIRAIQQETTQAVERMGKGAEEVRTGVDLAEQAGQSLGAIVTRTDAVAGVIQSISAAAEEASAGAAQAASAAEVLSRKAEQLKGAVERFAV